jgi:hypothetical protein
MAVHAMGWAFDQQDVSPLAKFILVILADGCHDEGPTQVPIETLTRLSGMSRHSALDSVRELERAGKVSVYGVTDVFIEVELRLPALRAMYAQAAKPEEKAGFLYVAEAGGLTKIGITTNPDSRMKALAAAGGRSVWLAKLFSFQTIEHARIIERAAHEHFAPKRSAGEWFKITPDEATALVAELIGA